MVNAKKYALLVMLVSSCRMQAAAYAGRAVKAVSAAGIVAAVGSVIAYKVQTDRLLARPKAWAVEHLKNSPENCTLNFTSDLMIDNYDEVFLVRNKAAKNADARSVYDDFSHYHRIDPSLAKRPVTNLTFCASGRCVALPDITTRKELESFLEKGGMRFNKKAKIFAEELASWQTQETPEEHYRRLEKE
jgi:hypothetical protein